VGSVRKLETEVNPPPLSPPSDGLLRLFRHRVGDLLVRLVERRQHLGRAAQDPHRLATPLDGHHLAGGKLADIGLDRRASGAGPFGRRQAGDEGNGSGRGADSPGRGSRDQEPTTFLLEVIRHVLRLRWGLCAVR